MLTDYSVHCPHAGCGWAGSLFPQGPREGVGQACPTQNLIRFHCPRCQGEWHARIVGEDAITVPLEAPAVQQA